MEVFIEKTKKTVKVNKSFAKANDLLKELKISQSSVLITRDNEILLGDEPLKKSDKIILLSVVSGG